MTWETVPLSEIARVDAGTIQPADIDPQAPYVGLEHMRANGRIDTATLAGRAGLKSAKNTFDIRHVLFGKLRPNLGKVAAPDVAGVCSTDIYPLLPATQIDRRYLTHFLLSPSAVSYASSRTSGVNLPRISWSALRELRVPLPPLPEQRRIAAILDEADTLRAHSQRMAELYEDVPASLLADIDQSAWLTVAIQDIAELQGGLTVSARRASFPHEMGYLRVANVMRGEILLDEIKSLGVTENERTRTQLRTDDVLVVEGHGNVEEVGRAARVVRLPDHALSHQNHLFRLRPRPGIVTGTYLELVLNAAPTRLRLRRVANTTSGLNTLSASNVRSTRVPLAPFDIQQQLTERVASLSEQQRNASQRIARTDEIFVSIQHRAFRGEL